MAATPAPTLVGTYPSRHDADIARERLEAAGITPISVEQVDRDVWLVHAPADRRADALAELELMEQHRDPGF